MPQCLVVEIVSEPNLARKLGQVTFAPPAHQLVQGQMDKLTLGAGSGERKSFLHECVVEDDVGSHEPIDVL